MELKIKVEIKNNDGNVNGYGNEIVNRNKYGHANVNGI